MGDFLKKAVVFLGSFELAFILLVLLGLLTFVGTLAQVDMSLYDVQQTYFESFLITDYKVGPIPVPLLGGYLLLSIFFVNIVVGGIIRIRKGKSTVGILISHVGIVFLLAGSFVEFQLSTKGQMTLWEPEEFADLNGNGQWDPGERFDDANRNMRYDDGESGSAYKSTSEWEVVVTELKASGGAREYIIPQDHFEDLGEGDSTRYTHQDLPFDVVLSGYALNAEPRPARASEARAGVGLDGFVLLARDPVTTNNMRNLPGIIASLKPTDGGKAKSAILWGGSMQRNGNRIPWPVSMGGKSYQVDLRSQTWDLPFAVRLNRFVHKRHAGIAMAKEYSSYVTKIQDGQLRDIHITMNEPMRHQGVTLYQTGWGPQDQPRAKRFWSTFSVVENPSDRIPMWACIVIAIGLLWHFLRRLYLHLKAESRRRTAAAQGGSA